MREWPNLHGVPDEPTPTPTPAPTPPAPTGVSEAEVAKREKAAATAAAKAAREELDAYLADEKAKQDRSKMEETDRLKAEKADAEAKAQQAEARVAQLQHDQLVQSRLLVAGVPADAVERVSTMVRAEVGSDTAAIDADIAQVKETLPQVFAKETPPPNAPGTVKPATPPAARTGGETEFERGQRESLQRRGLLKSA